MDLLVRYWNDTCHQITARYLSSSFMGKSTANDDQSHSKLRKEKVIQVSSDGPNVNLKFINLVIVNRSDDELRGLISIDTSGLHTIHVAFQHGAKFGLLEKFSQQYGKS